MTRREDGRIAYLAGDPPVTGEALEVAPGIFWMRIALPMVLDHVNVYALDDGDGWTIVDTGLGTRRIRETWQSILSGPLGARPVKRLIVTHHHPDHVGLAGWFQSTHGAVLWMTRTAWLMARMLTLDEQDRPVPETVAYWRAAGMAPDILDARLNERPFNFADVVAPMPLGFRALAEGDVLHAAGRDWTVRIGNGHAPAHATLWSADGDIVIGGDQLLPSISPNLGAYATEPLADPVGDWLESCARLLPYATGRELVLPGHKQPYRGLDVRLRQLAENHEGALERVRTHLRTPATAAGCFQPLFMRDIGEGEYGLALVEAMAHCLYLWHRGEVAREIAADGAWLWRRL